MTYEGFNIDRVMGGLDERRGVTVEPSSQAYSELVAVDVLEPKVAYEVPVSPIREKTRNANRRPSRGVVIASVGALAALVAGVVVGNSHSASSDIAAPANKPTKPVIVPANPLPTASTNAQPPTNSLRPTDSQPIIDSVPYTLGQISFGEKGKDCVDKGSVTTATFAKTQVPFELKGMRYMLTIPQMNAQLSTCGNDIKAFVQNGETVTIQGTDGEYSVQKKQVLLNKESFETNLVLSKYAPTVKDVLPAQIAQQKGYTGKNDYCVAFPNTVGCKGVKVPTIYHLPAGILPVIVLSTEISILKEAQEVCAPKQDAAVTEIVHDYFVEQVKNQNIDPSIVSEIFLDSAGLQTKIETNFIGSTIAKLYKKDKTGMVKNFEKVFTPYINGKVTCSDNRQRK